MNRTTIKHLSKIVLRISVALFLLLGLTAQANAQLEYMVRENTTDTTAVSTAETPFAWNSQTHASGTAVGYIFGEFQLATGKYLVLYTQEWETTDTTTNTRKEIQGRLAVGGTTIDAGSSQCYIRKTGGDQSCVTAGNAVLDITADDTILSTNFYKTDDDPTGIPTRENAGQNGVQVIKLGDDWNYGRYSLSTTQDTTLSATVFDDVVWDTTDEEDTGFTRSGSGITIADAGRYLVSYSLPVQIAESSTRTDITSRLALDGNEVEGTRVSTYMRGNESTSNGVLNYVGVIDVAAGDVLKVQEILTSGAQVTYQGGSIEIVQLPASAKTFIREATTGDQNPASLTEFSWDSTAHIDTDTFTINSATDSFTEVDSAGDYLFFWSAWTDSSSATRGKPSAALSVNDALVDYGLSARYHRANGTDNRAGHSNGAFVPSMSAGDDVSVEVVGLSAAGTMNVSHGAHSGLRLDTLYATAPAVSTTSISGTLYSLFYSPITSGRTVVAAVATSTPSTFTTTSDGSGSYTIDLGVPYTGGEIWTGRTAASGNNDSWVDVAYGNGRFVAVSDGGNGSDARVMYSDDGYTWTLGSALDDNDAWQSVVYGNGLFVAVSHAGDRVMTSPDGVTWTARSAASDDDSWRAVTYGNGLFVAVGSSGDPVMTSPDGITWTARSAAGNNDSWNGVTYGNGLFVAVGDSSGPEDPVMTSPDGITWTARSAAGNDDIWQGVAYGNGVFVAVAESIDRVITSPDGITWTARSILGNDEDWNDVTYANGTFVAVSGCSLGGDDCIATSPDGITWTSQTHPSGDDWWAGVTYGQGKFVAVGDECSYTGGDCVMTADAGFGENTPITIFIDGATEKSTILTYGQNEPTAIAGMALTDQSFVIKPSSPDSDLVVDLSNADFYDADDDADILFGSDTGTTTISAGFSSILDTQILAPQKLDLLGGLQLSGSTEFNAERGEVLLASVADQELYTVATTTFFDLTAIATSARELKFSSGEEFVIEGDLVLSGAPGELTTLAAFSADSEFYIRPNGAVTTEYLDVKDSHNISTVNTSLNCSTGCVDSGNNSGWSLPAPSITKLVFDVATSTETFVVPEGVTSLSVKAWGAGGGGGGISSGIGGGGGFVGGDIAVTPGETLNIYVGGGGGAASDDAGGGGGYTALKRGSTVLFMAGAGGGAGTGPSGGAGGSGGVGGGLTGGAGGEKNGATGGGGGTQSAGGSPGIGGLVGEAGTSEAGGDGNGGSGTGFGGFGGLNGGGSGGDGVGGGGGGAGYYGGAGGGFAGSPGTGGGGGSSYSIFSATATSTVSGYSINIPGNRYDEDHDGNAGYGRAATFAGEDGLMVLSYATPVPSISGTLYEADGVTPITTGKTITAAVGTSTPSLHSVTTDGSGNFSFDSLTASAGGETWTAATPAGAYDELSAITYGNGQFVAVSTCYYSGGNCVVTSPDGLNWTGRTTGTASGQWVSVTYGNGLFVAVGLDGDRVMTSPDGIAWTERAAAGDNDQWTGVTFGNGRFVAVANNGDYAMYSDDGITWTTSASVVSGGWENVTYANGQYVAVATFGIGDGHHVMTSPDGINWTGYHAAEDNNWQRVVYGNGTYVAVSNDGSNRAMTSSNGQTWTARSIAGNNDDWQDLSYANGQFVAVADCDAGGDCVATSPDGVTWTVQTAPANSWRGLTFGGSKFVAVGAFDGPNRVMYSDAGLGENTPITLYVDGDTEKATTLTYALNDGAEVSGMDLYQDTVRVQHPGTTGDVDLYDFYTYDFNDDSDVLHAWVAGGSGTTSYMFNNLNVAANTTLVAPQQLIVAGSMTVDGEYEASRGTFYFLNDSATTTHQLDTASTITFHDFYAAAYFDGTAIEFKFSRDHTFEGVFGTIDEGEMLIFESSNPGYQYQLRPNGVTDLSNVYVQDSNNVSFINDPIDCTTGCVDGGNNDGWEFPGIPSITGTLYESDGVTPLVGKTITAAVGTSTPSLHTATTDGSGDFSITGIASSTGGETWTARSAAGNDDRWIGVTYGNGMFVAVSQCGSVGNTCIMTSPDGITWTERTYTGAGGADLYSVAYGNGMFVAVGWGVVLTSPDGITWTSRSVLGTDDYWTDVTYGNGQFVAVAASFFGGGDTIMTSPDGITWTSQTPPSGTQAWLGVTYGNGLFVAVEACSTDNQCVMTSPDGVTWTKRTAISALETWNKVTYGNGLFVAVSDDDGGTGVMTSPDGITWTSRWLSGTGQDLYNVMYANGLFIATGELSNNILTSLDGITWSLQTISPTNGTWTRSVYANGLFVAVGGSDNGSVMTADAGFGDSTPITLYVDGEMENATTLTYGLNDAETITGLDLIQDTVHLQHSSTTGEVDLYDFYTYDFNDDDDVLHSWVSGGSGTTSYMFNDLSVAANTTFIAPQQLIVAGDMTIDGDYEASRGTFYFLNDSATTTHQLNTSATTTFHSFYAAAYFDGTSVEFTSGEEYVFEGDFGTIDEGEVLAFNASTPGSEYYVRPDGATYFTNLDVQDSHNISTVNTSIDCTTGCADGGNNVGWNIPLTDLSVTGVVYQADGITPLTGKTVTAAVGTSTPSLHSATTDGSGEYMIDLGAPYTSVTTWATSSMMGDDDDWTGYAYGNGVHVIVARFDGGNGKVGYSTDGINWTQTSAAGDNGDWYGVTYGNGLFVAVGDSTGTRDSVMTSPDGINWTARSAVGDNDNWTDVAYGGGAFVAIARCNYSGDDCAMISEDGINWTSVTMPSGNDDEWAKLAYGDGRFVAIQNSGPAGVSTDGGATWTEYAMIGNNENWSDITYGDGRFVAVSNIYGSSDRIAYSADGTSWTSVDQVSADNWIGVTHGNGLYVAVGNANNHTVAYSSDAVTWTKIEVADGDDEWGTVGFGGGRFMAFGNAGTGADDNFMYANAGFGADTPITIFVDGETEKASALTYGRNEVGVITGINLVEDSVFLRHSSTTGTINFSRTDLYDATDDVDVLFTATGGTTTVTGDLVVDTNTTLLGPQKLELQNDLTINGTFAAQGGEVLLTGGDQTITTSATTTFYDFTAATTSARTLTFTSGEEYVFTGELVLSGANGNLTSLTASTPDSEYFFRPNAVATAQYLDIQDAHNISTTTAVIECGGGCVDSGNISGWNFPVTNITLSGTLYESDGVTPITTSKSIVAAVGTSTPSLHTATTNGSGDYSIDIGAPAAGGAVWSTATPAGAWDELKAITYGGGQYVAVSTCYYAGGNCVVTSPDGETWTGRSTGSANGDWFSVVYGAEDGLFAAVGHINDYVMTSPDGITWTPRSAAGDDDQWNGITYGDGRFVAVANTGDFAMYSDDGVTWATSSSVIDGGWEDVTYGNGQFVAVATFGFGDGHHVMTSPDGDTWTAYHAAEDNDWQEVEYGNGVYVAISNQGTNRAMTSPDGQTWTARSIAGNDDDWQSLEFADGVFVAVADCDAGGDCVATSPDGITWTVQTAPANSWRGVAAGDGKFVAVGAFDGPDRVMYSESGLSAGTPITLYINDETEKATTLTYGLATPAAVTGMDLYQDTVRLQHSSTSGAVDVSNTAFYDATDDVDILLDVTAATTTVAADLIVHTNTELQAPQKLELQNDLTINGTFAAQGGEVLLTGGDQTITTSATTTFHDFTAATTSARTLTFTSGEEYVFTGELVLSGANGNLTSLTASTPDSEYYFRPNATATAEYLDVTDSHNISTTTTTIECATDCVDSGNNVGWGLPIPLILSGTLFESDGVTPLTGKTITAAVGTSTPSLHTATTDGSGNYSIDLGVLTAEIADWVGVNLPPDMHQVGALVYGNGVFVAGRYDYSLFTTSPDGVNWSEDVYVGDAGIGAITYADGKFVAVGRDCFGTYACSLTSFDGLQWATSSAVGDNDNWTSVTYGDGQFVAVADSGTDRVMTSPDGITWTARSAAGNDDQWNSVTYGDGQFVAVADSGTDRVMTSPDGITWTARSAAGDNDNWTSVTYGEGLLVAVGGGGDRVMTSPDGITWTARSAAGDNDLWSDVLYLNGQYIATGICFVYGDDECAMSSVDGITWTVDQSPSTEAAGTLAYGNGRLLSLADGGTSAYAPFGFGADTPITIYVDGETEKATTLTYGKNTGETVTNLDLVADTVRLQHSSTTGTIDLSKADFYDASDDADILFTATTSTTTITGGLEIASGTLLKAPQNLVVTGDLAIGGTFTDENGEVLLTGGDQTITASATTTFYDFTAATTSARALTFTSGEEYVFEGELVLSGASGSLTSLTASTPDSEYYFRPNATATAEYLDVTDSHNISTTNVNIDCTGQCISGGNNSGWAVITVAALAATDVSAGTATLNGNVVANGGVAVTNRGFIYSTESDFSSNVATSSESSSYNISSAVFEGVALDVSPQESAPYALLFNDDGTVLYVMGVAQDDIRSYNLSVAYDISSAVYDEIVLDVSPQETVPTDMLFNDDGTVLYVLGYSNDNVNAYTLSVAYDISTAVFDSVALDVVSEGVPKGMTFNDDGTVLYVMGSAQDNIRSYNLSVAYDISSAVHDGVVLDVSPQETNPYSLLFNDDGTELYVIGFVSDAVHTYSLSVPFDVSSAVYESVALDVSSQEGAPAEIMFNNDGTRLYVTGEGDDEINAYTLTFAEGVYSRDITSLEGGTAYYARAFAENSFGVAYSTTTVSFTTDIPAVLDIADNDAGQVSDAFSFQNKTDTELFAFKLSTTTVGLTVTEFDIALTGIKNVTANDIQNVELYVDVDGDAEYDDGLDTLVGTGAVTISGVTGNITFATDFAIAGAVNYLVIGDTVSIENGSFITFNLFTRDIEVVGGVASGAVSSIQHSRNNRGGGGGSAAAIVDEVIPGDGDVGGGSSGGGGEIDTNTGGALIGDNPNFKAPTSYVGSWTNPEYAYDNTDGTYATTSNSSFNDYTSYVLGVPGSNTIQGIEVKLELSGTTAAGTVDVQLSWDNRRTWTSVKTTPVLTTTDAVVSLGGPSDLWGRTWADGDFNTGNFAVRLVGNPSSNEIRVDEIRVRVYHQATGGGSGGGGGAI